MRTGNRNGASESRAIVDAADCRETLRGLFGIALSAEETAGLPIFADR